MTKSTVITYATTSSAFSYTVGSKQIRQTWLDGSGKVIYCKTDSPRGRYLVSLAARKGFAKTR
jgi:hypothetical protein